MNNRVLRLEEVAVSRRAIHGRYAFGDMRFATSTWYDSVDFGELRSRFGEPAVDRIAFHVAAFDINKLASLRPARLDWGAGARWVTPAFAGLWREIHHNVWAQWRFENQDWDYRGPDFAVSGSEEPGPQGERSSGVGPGVLAFCGGGKDSLLAMALLDAIGRPFDTLAYASQTYGDLEAQHRLADAVAVRGGACNRRRQWITDDFQGVPVTALRDDLGVRAVTAAETPASIFAALPLALQHGYDRLCLAHERSADAPQAHTPAGEPVNHQWGKSLAAEALIDDYIGAHLVAGLRCFSILKPIHDLAIFGALRPHAEAIPQTHSCNVSKPWCMRCAKCLYVWLGFAAFLDPGTVRATFGDADPLDQPLNIPLYRQLAGLGDRLPFECVGEADEAALYLLMCRARGRTGVVLDACAEALDRLDPQAVMSRCLTVATAAARLPADMAAPLDSLFAVRAAETRRFIAAVLKPARPVAARLRSRAASTTSRPG